MQVDAGRLVVRGAGELGQPGNLAVVDGVDLARPLRQKRSLLARLSAAPAFRLAPRRCAGISSRRARRRALAPPSPRPGPAAPCPRARAARRRARSPAARRSRGASGSHRRTARTSRASSAGPMPRPTGCNPSVSTTLVCSPNVSATLDERARQRLAGLRRSHLRGRADGKIDHQMGGAGGDLLRQHRSDHLPFGIEIERPLDADEDVVGRAQLDRAAPDHASALALDDAANGGCVEIDRRHRLHRVRGSGRRGDRARRCLRHHQAERSQRSPQ